MKYEQSDGIVSSVSMDTMVKQSNCLVFSIEKGVYAHLEC